jgi:hypothetical protein
LNFFINEEKERKEKWRPQIRKIKIFPKLLFQKVNFASKLIHTKSLTFLMDMSFFFT